MFSLEVCVALSDRYKNDRKTAMGLNCKSVSTPLKG